jgi:hypothetical protein
VTIAGCAQQTPASPVSARSDPTQPVDGRYRGTARLIRAERAGCPRSGARVLEVRGASLTMTYVVHPREIGQLTAAVRADGTFQAGDGVGSLDGTLRGGLLEATIASPMCVNHWSLRRVR